MIPAKPLAYSDRRLLPPRDSRLIRASGLRSCSTCRMDWRSHDRRASDFPSVDAAADALIPVITKVAGGLQFVRTIMTTLTTAPEMVPNAPSPSQLTKFQLCCSSIVVRR